VTQAETVRRRLVEATCKEVVEQAWPLRIFSRETIVEGLVMCDGSVERFNILYNAWRKQRAVAAIKVVLGPSEHDVQCDEEPGFLDFIRRSVDDASR